MAETLSPFVYWGQTKGQISLKIEIRDVVNEVVRLTEDGLSFSAEGVGIKGHNFYEFNIDFYLSVDPEDSKYRVMDRGVEFQIKKTGEGEVWPRLTEQKVKYPWLKIDFDKVAYDESDLESDTEGQNEEIEEDEVMRRLEKELADGGVNTGPNIPDLKTMYLFVYNLFQFIGFLYIFFALSYNFFKDQDAAFTNALEIAGTQMFVVQIVAFMEIIHPLIGLVKSSPIPAFMQVIGRNFMLFLVILNEPRLHERPVVFVLFVIWSSIELIRYPFYMLSVLGASNKFITWLRYTAWIPLYPMGLLTEASILAAAIPMYEQTLALSSQLPNSYNFSFSFAGVLKVYLFIFGPASFYMLNNMYQQRKKVLGRLDTKSQKKD